MAADCTEALSVMNVPRSCGLAAEVMMAMPGIMRPLMKANISVDTISTVHSGTPCTSVMPSRQGPTARASQRKVATLPRASVRRPNRRAVNSVTTPPHR